jgi:hypothetical protein
MDPPASCQDVSIRIQSSRPFPATVSEIGFDSYRIRPIPTSDGEEAILEFKDEWVNGQMASHPVQEGKFVLSWLAVMLRSRLYAGASEINNVPFPNGQSAYKQFLAPIDPPQDLQVLFDKLCALDEKLLRTYLRACDLYHLAAQVIDDRPSLANFLLVSSIECLATIVSPGNSYKGRFLNFIKRFCPKAVLGANMSEQRIDGLLSTIHSYRSQYAHGGKDVPVASLVADRHALVWVRYFDDGKEELAPSISWFESIVQASLMEFFRSQSPAAPPPRKREKLINLALSYATLRVKAKRSIAAGELLTREDVTLQ